MYLYLYLYFVLVFVFVFVITCPVCFSRRPPSSTRPSGFSVAEILEWAAPVSLLVDHLPVV